MNGDINVKVTGGSFTVGQMIQGKNVQVSGSAHVQSNPEAFRALREEVEARALTDEEHRSLNERLTALDSKRDFFI
ncbi:MAG: hypothetical protein ACXW23_20945, partial [Telluria sp.]